MKDIVLTILVWPVYRLREVLASRRFDALSRAATHAEMRAHGEGITLVPEDMTIPWGAIVEARWSCQTIARLAANSGQEYVVTLRTSDGRTRIVGPMGECSDAGNFAAMESLKARGMLPTTPEDGGATGNVSSGLVDIVWLSGVLLVVLLALRC